MDTIRDCGWLSSKWARCITPPPPKAEIIAEEGVERFVGARASGHLCDIVFAGNDLKVAVIVCMHKSHSKHV